MSANLVNDPTRGEVRVEEGEGIIEKLGDQAKRNVQVEIRATHTNLRHPVKGWLDTWGNEAARDVALQAHAEGRAVRYRIETHRKDSVAIDRPLADLGNDEKVRDLVSLQLLAGAPAGAGAAPAENARQAAPERPSAPEPADDGGVDPTADNAAQEPTARRGPKLAEAKPWEHANSDGSLNLGSYEVTAAVGMVELAYEQLVSRGEPFTIPQARYLGRHLLTAADNAQSAIRPDGRVDRMDNSHTRARGAVRTALERIGVPWGAEKPAVATWVDELAAEAAAILQAGIALLGD